MREIKFRAWDNLSNFMIENNELIIRNFNPITYWEEFIKMQYTGLKDKNGIDIYEGDIVSTKNSIYEVVFDKCCFWGVDALGKYPIFQIKHYTLDDEKFEVVGNIYENKELLNANQNT